MNEPILYVLTIHLNFVYIIFENILISAWEAMMKNRWCLVVNLGSETSDRKRSEFFWILTEARKCELRDIIISTCNLVWNILVIFATLHVDETRTEESFATSSISSVVNELSQIELSWIRDQSSWVKNLTQLNLMIQRQDLTWAQLSIESEISDSAQAHSSWAESDLWLNSAWWTQRHS